MWQSQAGKTAIVASQSNQLHLPEIPEQVNANDGNKRRIFSRDNDAQNLDTTASQKDTNCMQ